MNITDDDVKLEAGRLAFLATVAIERSMKSLGIRRSELATRLGIPKSRVTKVLDGESNVTLKTLAAFGLACGVRWNFMVTPTKTETDNDSRGVAFARTPLSAALASADWIPHQVSPQPEIVCAASAAQARDPEGPLLSRWPGFSLHFPAQPRE